MANALMKFDAVMGDKGNVFSSCVIPAYIRMDYRDDGTNRETTGKVHICETQPRKNKRGS